MEWLKFHYICRTAKSDALNSNKTYDDIIGEIESRPESKLYETNIYRSKTADKLLQQVKKLPRTEQSNHVLECYSSMNLTPLSIHKSNVTNRHNYPIVIAMIFFVIALLFNQMLIPQIVSFFDYYEKTAPALELVRDNKLLVVALLVLVLTILYGLYLFALKKMMDLRFEPDTKWLGLFLTKQQAALYTNLYWMVKYPVRSHEQEMANNNPEIKLHLVKLFNQSESGLRDYGDLMMHTIEALSLHLYKTINKFKAILVTITTMSIALLIFSIYTSIMGFGALI